MGSDVGCEDFRDAISADLDGEEPAVDRLRLHAHLASCAACQDHERAARALHRALRVRPADPVPDLSAAILAAVPRRAAAPVREWARYALLAVGLAQLVLALPALVLGSDPGASVHIARELGSWDLALAAALLLAAWQPHRAAGLLPFALALAGAMVLTAALDVSAGRAPFGGEAHHALDIAGLVLLWLVSRAAPGLSRIRRTARLTAA